MFAILVYSGLEYLGRTVLPNTQFLVIMNWWRRTLIPNPQYVVIMEKGAAHSGSKSSIYGHNGKEGSAQWFRIFNMWS